MVFVDHYLDRTLHEHGSALVRNICEARPMQMSQFDSPRDMWSSTDRTDIAASGRGADLPVLVGEH